MKMTDKEYGELMEHFEFLEDKVEACYKRETKAVLQYLKAEYEKYVVRY